MVKRMVLAALAVLAGVWVCAADRPLTVVQSGPSQEVRTLEEVNEVRVLFSEPMVMMGRIPDPVTAPFFTISPPIAGGFRWSGTRLLIFTPAHTEALPYATSYTVTVGTSATSVEGKKLAAPHRFTFTTPTARLQGAQWLRKGGRYDSQAVLLMRFNQPVEPQKIAAHARLNYLPHDWKAPAFQKEVLGRLAQEDPQAFGNFQKKVTQTLLAAKASAPVAFAPAAQWDQQHFPPQEGWIAFETSAVPPPEAQIRLVLDGAVPSPAGPATPGDSQEYTFSMEPAFFVDGLHCSAQCSVEYWNAVEFSTPVKSSAARAAVKMFDLTADPKGAALTQAPEKKSEEETGEYDEGGDSYGVRSASFDRLGFTLQPARDYLVRMDKSLKSADGQELGYTWLGRAEYWHKSAFISFGEGHGVWEKSSGPQLPFYARNLNFVDQWQKVVTKEELVPAALTVEGYLYPPEFEEWGGPKRNGGGDARLPGGEPRRRTLHPEADKTQNYGFDLAPGLSPDGTGLLWLGLRKGDAIPKAVPVGYENSAATLVQVTNLGLTVKDSPINTLVWVTTLDKGEAVSGATVELRNLANKVLWSGTTGPDGVALAPDTPTLREKGDSWYPQFVVVAQKGADIGYCVSDWNEGMRPWEFGVREGGEEVRPLLRGSAFADRGVYKLGEEVHVKLILRSDTARGMTLMPAGTKAEVVVEDSRGGEQDKRTVTLSEWGSADWVLTIADPAPLGHWSVTVKVDGQWGDVGGGFLVAAYRKPDFRVDTNLMGLDALAGVTLKGVITGRYLFGAAMGGKEVRWTYTRDELGYVPEAVTERCPPEQYAFLKESWTERDYGESGRELQKQEGKLGPDGSLHLDLETDKAAGVPYTYTLEGEVTDVSRQTLAGRASFAVHPASWYLGLKRPGFFADTKTGVVSEVVAITPRGERTAGVAVHATLTQVQWISVRRAEGEGMYVWESEVRKREVWAKDLTTAKEPVPLTGPLAEGGDYVLSVTATDAEGRTTTTDTEFYALGAGYTAWARYDHNRIDLIPERKTYRPGDTARILVKSPWERATALLTVEREGIKTYKPFTLTSTQQTITVPITEEQIPNLFVSVVLVRGRTGETLGEDGSDPGKPAFRVGYCELNVENLRKRLAVTVGADKEEYRPAETAKFTADLKDGEGKPVVGEVTLWAVDYGVLSLTGYQTPDLLPQVWVPKGLAVNNEDSRQRIISRRVLTPKGADEGGGGGYDSGPTGQIRKDFRVLALWVGSAVADAKGHVEASCKLPESLTTFRIMAVAQDKRHRFGLGQKEIRVSKPLLLTPAFPRFLAVGDKALFGAVLHSLLKEGGTALVSMKSLDPERLVVTGEGVQQVTVAAAGQAEVRFGAEAKGIGSARLLVTAKLLGEEDAFELVLPVKILATREVVAAYGTAAPDARETVELPAGVLPGTGGLQVELSSTAMVGLGEGARYLVDYPYGCAEQKASSALALILASDLGDAFRLPGIEPADLKKIAQRTLKELELYQCDNGGFVYWKGDPCDWTSAYLTAYVLHVFQRGAALGYTVDQDVLDRGYGYLEEHLNRERPLNEAYMTYYTAWQAFACKVLAEGGRTVDSHVTRLYGFRDHLPVFGLCHLFDAMAASGEKGARPDDLVRRVRNAILPEGGTSHVEETDDPYLTWCWSSNARTTAVALGTLVRAGSDDPMVLGMVRWLMKVRKQGRWGNTQENAWAMGSLVDYYKKYEKEVPDFSATVAFGLKTLVTAEFRGRSTEVKTGQSPMTELLASGAPGTKVPLTFHREGTGTLHYAAHLTYAASDLFKQPMDMGIAVSRSYAPMAGGPSVNSFKAGDLVQVTLKLHLTKQRNWVAVTDPLPAGFEPVESWFATTARDLTNTQDQDMEENQEWREIWERGGFDHVERHDDRVLLFATRLSEGEHTFRYVCRATTAGTFRTESAHAEEMYEPEVFGRTATDVVEVKP